MIEITFEQYKILIGYMMNEYCNYGMFNCQLIPIKELRQYIGESTFDRAIIEFEGYCEEFKNEFIEDIKHA